MKHYKVTLTRTQRSNLRKLATYLESLPAVYKHFDMAIYFRGSRNLTMDSSPAECGTVACAAGHGPAAGIKPNAYYWSDYVGRNFTDDDGDVYEFLFASSWCEIDNTHQGAAQRIRYFLKFGIPPISHREAVTLYTTWAATQNTGGAA